MGSPCQQIAAQMGELYLCSQVNGYTRIRTPFLYPDGDVIDLFLREHVNGGTLTDLGETLRWLRVQSLSKRKSPKQRKLIEDVCITQGVEIFRGMLLVRFRGEEQIAGAVARLSQAALRVADLWFTLRTRAVETVTDEVADFLDGINVRFDKSPQIPGRSGRIWRPDFHTRVEDRSSLVNVLTTGTRAAARLITEHVLAEWYDLSHLGIGPEALHFISLFDDTVDVWSPEDFQLVSSLSEVSRWSRPDEFARAIGAAA